MNPRTPLLRRPRVLAEARFALGAAVAGAGVGLALALLSAPPADPGVPSAPLVSRWIGATAPAVVIGWWVGLFWSVALALHVRGWRQPPPVERLGRGLWLTVVLAAVAGGLAAWLWSAPGWGAAAGIAGGTLAAGPLAATPYGNAGG